MKTALELGKDIASGKIDPVELTEQTLAEINAHEHRDTIFARTTEDRARTEAEAARTRQKSGDLKSPLDGVPISWKDLFDTAEIATESGSQLLGGRTPTHDCAALEHATKAGLVCVGKTHLSELAFSGLGINPKTATSPNKQGKHLAPGGSSSGAAASVAYELVPIGIGSDTGGSVRIPSAWNDLVGFKTTHGLISDRGVVPLCSGFDTAGPLCTSVADAWTMVAIMADQNSSVPDEKPLSNCRFVINETITLDEVESDQKDGFDHAIEALKSAGATIDQMQIPEFEEILPLGPILFPYEAWQEWGELIEATPGVMFEPVANRFGSGKDLTRNQYDTAMAQMMVIRETYNRRVQSYDAVLAPTVAIAPPNVEALLADYDLFSATNMMALRNTRFFNMFGCCALTLPTSKPASGLMIAAQGGQDRALASIGLSIENVI
ncbi:MAG: amidase family protein [Rhizobiaceae bacterium]|nr:amidase family protein [Rhizobiaceae bacterium]